METGRAARCCNRTAPFWSSRSRREDHDRCAGVPGHGVLEIDLSWWKERWLPGLEKDGLLLGLNWSGERATEFDIEPSELLRSLAARSKDSLPTRYAADKVGLPRAAQRLERKRQPMFPPVGCSQFAAPKCDSSYREAGRSPRREDAEAGPW